jgi:hypothetical protein
VYIPNIFIYSAFFLSCLFILFLSFSFSSFLHWHCFVKYSPLILMMTGRNYFQTLIATVLFRSIPEITANKLNGQIYKQNTFGWILSSLYFGLKQVHAMFLGLEKQWNTAKFHLCRFRFRQIPVLQQREMLGNFILWPSLPSEICTLPAGIATMALKPLSYNRNPRTSWPARCRVKDKLGGGGALRT